MVVSLTGETDAAAGFYIPLAPRWHRQHTYEQSDFAHGKFLTNKIQISKFYRSAKHLLRLLWYNKEKEAYV